MSSTSDVVIIAEGPSKPIIKIPFKKKKVVPQWGEYRHKNVSSEEEDDESTLELIQEVTKKAMKQDTESETTATESFYIELPPNVTAMDPVVLHTVQLNAHSSILRGMIKDIYESSDLSDEQNQYPDAPDIPTLPEPIKRRPFNFPFVQLDREETDFILGLAKPELGLSFINARVFLRKSVAALFAHAGFEEAIDSSLDVVTDIVGEVYNNLADRLRVAVDQQAMSGQNGFHDPIERVFTEMNLGTLNDLFSYYQEKIIDYHDKAEELCIDYTQEYTMRVKSKFNGLTEMEQEEEFEPEEEEEGMDEENDDEDVPEIHFPALDMEDQLGLQPSLVPGFQMLDSLEHDETLQNLDADEEINVSDSEFMLSVISELTNTIESTKSKKKKSRK